MAVVAVPVDRFPRWVENFQDRHGTTDIGVQGGALVATAADTSTFAASLPFSRAYDGPATVAAFLGETSAPPDWAVLLVRKGGFAIARLSGAVVVASKVGQRHVQGRTAAGGQSQQRFARRRDNQARAAFEAAAEHAARLIADTPVLVVGGDATAVAAVLEDPRLSAARDQVVGAFQTVPDPRRAVLQAACAQAQSVSITVINA